MSLWDSLKMKLGFGISGAQDTPLRLEEVSSSHVDEAASWEPGQVVLEKYRVDGVLGKGGMGKVYLLKDLSTGKGFAVKRILVKGENERRGFLAELQTWLDLPEYPHIVACRFFRTVGDEIVIFSEHIDGGSLLDRIKDLSIYSEDGGGSLRRILDISIQFAWGLQALHNLGYMHQDVKPANVLLAPDGKGGFRAKVSDFGLVRGRSGGGGATASSEGSILVAGSGMTPPYCSPEQKNKRPLSRRTDVWSYGVSLLHVFAGELSWGKWGTDAPEALKGYLDNGKGSLRTAMPAALAELLLKGCFRTKPEERLRMGQVAEKLMDIYRSCVNEEYPGKMPETTIPAGRGLEHDRMTTTGVKWTDPCRYLLEAGYKQEDMERLFPARSGTRKSQAVYDLAVYEEAVKAYEKPGNEEALASICINKALVHEHLDDYPGAVLLYDKAIELCERLVHKEGRGELANYLAMGYQNKGAALYASGDIKGAVSLCDQAIELFLRLVQKEGRGNLAGDLAMAYQNKALALYASGDLKDAVLLCDQAIELYERLVQKEGRGELAVDLSCAQTIRACVYFDIGDHGRASEEGRRALSVLEAEARRSGRSDLRQAVDYVREKLKDVL